MRNLIKHLLILSLLAPSISGAQSKQPVYTRAGSLDILKRTQDFIALYQKKESILVAADAKKLEKLPDPQNFVAILNTWEARAFLEAKGASNSQEMLDLARGTIEDKALEHKAEIIAEDTFKFLGGDSPAEFHKHLLEMFQLYVNEPAAREPLEMIFKKFGEIKFTGDHKKDLEKDKSLLRNLGRGSVATILIGAAVFWRSSPEKRTAILAKMGQHTSKASKAIATMIEAMAEKAATLKVRYFGSVAEKLAYQEAMAKKALDAKLVDGVTSSRLKSEIVGVEKGKELVLFGENQLETRQKAERADLEQRLAAFWKKYGRGPTASEIMTPEEAAHIPKEKLRIKIGKNFDQDFVKNYLEVKAAQADKFVGPRLPKIAEEAANAMAQKLVGSFGSKGIRGGRKVFSAVNRMALSFMSQYLQLSLAQQVFVMGRFMGIGAIGGAAYYGAARLFYATGEHQYTIIPEDEMSRYTRALAVLDLTCRAESLQNDIALQQPKGEVMRKMPGNISSLHNLINEYRYLLHVASAYKDDVGEALPIPSAINVDNKSGNISFRKNYEGEEFEIDVKCPTRKGRQFKEVTLLEARPVLEDIRNTLLATEMIKRTNTLSDFLADVGTDAKKAKEADAQAEDIAGTILNMSASGHNDSVDSLVPMSRGGNTAAQKALTILVEKMNNADPLKIEELGARRVPKDFLQKKKKG